MKKKVITIISILILIFITILAFATTSEGYTIYENGLTWYYEVEDGEAVNVYVYSGTPGSTVTIPNTLGGYPVTSIRSKNIYYNIFGGQSNNIVTKVIIPNTVTTIGDSAFKFCSKLESFNWPTQLEYIGKNAFHTCTSLPKMTIPNTVTKMHTSSFANIQDIYIDNYENSIEIVEDYLFVTDKMPYIHYKGCKQNLCVNSLNGINLIDVKTGEKVEAKDYECGSDVILKLERENGYDYDNLLITMETEGDYSNSDKVLEKLELNDDETININGIKRNKKIYIQQQKEGLDLSLRQYIESVNYKELANTRKPNAIINNGLIEYRHAKNPVYVKKGDKIVYNIRIYNEGTVSAKANKITQYLPDGLEFNTNSNINIKYEWETSEDGKTVTTSYLKPLNIEAYNGANTLNYLELQLECVVTADKTDDVQRLVNIAEIQSANQEDVDSIAGNITSKVNSEYMKQESENSNEDSYIVGTEDDNDFENVYISNKIPVSYAFRINKIDGINNELLNGAKFDLLNENKEILQTGVTADEGILDFGMIETKGEGTDIYYIKETNTPEGYKNTIKYLIKVEVEKELINETEIKTTINCDIADIDIDTSKYEKIFINTKEDLVNIENNKEKKYILMQDIDLQGEIWTPLNVSNVILDGNGHKISNLKINSEDQITKKFGLFGTYSGIIENLSLENVDIDVTKYVNEEENDTEEKEETEEDIDAVGAIIGYSENAILKNCKVTGTIDSTLRNVGGLVGHTKTQTILVLRDCVNESAITATSHNIGGMLGCGLGPVKVYNCTNKGIINAKSYNAAGLVGFVRPEGYNISKVIANYDNDNEVVNLAIKNERTSGGYNIKLQKLDGQNQKLLNGAKFQILNREKEVIDGYENIEVKNGILEFGITKIDCIGKDIYYIKEIEAPLGYSKISDDYIKLNIYKKWNEDEENYYIEADSEIISAEEFENIVVEEYDISSSKTGQIYNDDKEDNLTWNINEVEIEFSNNEGTITNTYEYTNTAGVIGAIEGRSIINKCSNTGRITSESKNVKVSGIVASIIQSENNNIAEVTNCTNLGEIEGTSTNSEGITTGIVAYSRIKIVIKDCNNKSNVIGNYTSCAGIIGNGVGIIEIFNCKNEGNIDSKNPTSSYSTLESAGIFAKNYCYDNSYNAEQKIVDCGSTKIDNCSNIGNINSFNHTSGIIALTNALELKVTNCNVNNCDLLTSEGGTSYATATLGGIVGDACTEKITINNCEVNNINNNNLSNANYTQTAGIIASVNEFGARSISSNDQNVDISKCNVIDSEIVSNGNNSSGIIAFGGLGDRNNIYINIFECNVNNSNIKTKNQIRDSAAVAGIYGQGYGIKQILINSCNVLNSTMEFESENGSRINVAGIYGYGYNWRDLEEITISNSQVNNSNIYNNARKNGKYGVNTAGVVSNSYISNKSIKFNIINTKVYDCDIKAETGNVGGLYNLAMSAVDSISPSLIENCTVEKTAINALHGVEGCDSMGGIAGAINVNTTFRNCNVIDSNLTNAESQNTAGMVGFSFGETEFIECNVVNTDIKSQSTRNSSSVAGIIATPYCDTYIYKCNVNNLEMEGNGQQLGGIMTCGITQRNKGFIIENSNVDNVEIKFNNVQQASSYNYSAVGGLVAGAASNEYQVKNSSLLNSNITSNAHSTGGIIGCAWGNSEISGCKTENVTIVTGNENNTSYYGSVGAIIGDAGYIKEVQSCIVKDVQIETTSDHIGGIIGTDYSELKISGCTVDNLTCTNKNTVKNTYNNGNNGRTIGGIVGVCSNLNIDSSVIKNVAINANQGVNILHSGGLIGVTYNKLTLSNVSTAEVTIKNKTSGSVGGIAGISIRRSNSRKFNRL